MHLVSEWIVFIAIEYVVSYFSALAKRVNTVTVQLQIKKPLIERRRRERINECLGQLKALVLEAANKDVRDS